MCRKFFALVILLFACSSAAAGVFVPEQPIMSVSELKSGMSGYMLTVMKGTAPVRIPVKIVSVIPQKPGRELTDEILIKITGGYKLAQGMSGSPVYVKGKLIGGVRSGWEMSDQTLAFVSPIESMCRVFDGGAERESYGVNLSDVMISGLSPRNSSIAELGRSLGMTFLQGMPATSRELPMSAEKLKPGDAVTVLLVWGDVEAGAVGTVTATAKDGRFLAFAHEFNKSGTSSYPAGKTYVHEIVNSMAFPFKLATPESITGTITNDREAGLGGKFGVYPPSIGAELIFRDLDTGTENKYKFRVIADEFLSRELLVKVFTALCEEAWRRKGAGTMRVNLRVDGKALPNGWTRSDIFYSDDNILGTAFKQAQAIINAYMIQPFSETMPAGFTMTVEASSRPKVLLIEDVMLSADKAKPGQEVGLTVKLRGWRTGTSEHNFTLKIPEDAEEGVSEIIVRGGNTEPMSQISVEEGWKSIDSLQRMFTEFKAADANNELIIELNADRLSEALKKALNRKKGEKSEPDLLPEQEEYLSETKTRRMNEGTLRVFSSEYFIDGMMKRIIHVEK